MNTQWKNPYVIDHLVESKETVMSKETEKTSSSISPAKRTSLSGTIYIRVFGIITSILFIVSCTPTHFIPGEELFGHFECVARTAKAKPPTKVAPMLVNPKEKEKIEPKKPLVERKLCKEGQVPVAKPARPNVAKGNPLIGNVKGNVKDFFKLPKEQSNYIRKQLRSFEEVYNRGPSKNEDQPVLPDPPGCNGIAYYGSCYYYGSASYSRTADGGGMTMSIERPAYNGSGGAGHSLDEIAVQGGSGNGDIVELGWNVSTSQYSNSNPHLFVFHWIGWSPTCYDSCGWQQYSSTYFPGMDLGTLVGHDVYVGYVYYGGNWWAWFDNQWLGYFPGSEWSGSYTKSSLIQWFGEVATLNGIPPHTDMGNGLFPTNTAAARNATLCDVDAVDWVCWYRDQQNLGATFPAYYEIDRSGFGQTRYGGAGE